MSNKILAILKNSGLILIFLFGTISCERDLENIAVDLVDNRFFSVGDSLIEIIAYNENVDSSRTDNNQLLKQPLYLFGVNQNTNFGHLKSTFISQVLLPIIAVDFGENAVIDQVVLDIPYYATRDGDQDAVDPITGDPINDDDGNPIQVPNFKLDSVYGNIDQEFNIKINELGTFLNVLDPTNPSKIKTYYSNANFDLNDELHSDNFITNRNDTVLYVERKYLDDDPNTVDDIDTIVAENSNPSIKFLLNESFFKERFIDHDNPNDFATNENFKRYFRGLVIDANGQDGALINILGLDAKMTIYYTNQETVDGVVVKSKRIMNFSLGGVRTGKYVRDYSNSNVYPTLMNPNKTTGEENLYIQGAAGSQVIIDLFTDENLEKLRNMNWLINEANITVYLDGDQNEVPQKLLLYNYEYNSYSIDLLLNGPEVFGGELEYDSEGNPEKYKFRITRYITDVLDLNDPKKPSKLAIKNYLSTDLPSFTLQDTIVSDYNWIPKGVVLKGNQPKVDEERIKLEIFYSKPK